MNEELAQTTQGNEEKPPMPDAGKMTLLAARQLLQALDARWPGGDDKRAGMFMNDGQLCIAVPWHDGYRIVALQESDYALPSDVIAGALDRFFAESDATGVTDKVTA